MYCTVGWVDIGIRTTVRLNLSFCCKSLQNMSRIQFYIFEIYVKFCVFWYPSWGGLKRARARDRKINSPYCTVYAIGTRLDKLRYLTYTPLTYKLGQIVILHTDAIYLYVYNIPLWSIDCFCLHPKTVIYFVSWIWRWKYLTKRAYSFLVINSYKRHNVWRFHATKMI
jgi:hypothetical protein